MFSSSRRSFLSIQDFPDETSLDFPDETPLDFRHETSLDFFDKSLLDFSSTRRQIPAYMPLIASSPSMSAAVPATTSPQLSQAFAKSPVNPPLLDARDLERDMVHPQRVMAAQHTQHDGERVVLRGPKLGVLDGKALLNIKPYMS